MLETNLASGVGSCGGYSDHLGCVVGKMGPGYPQPVKIRKIKKVILLHEKMVESFLL